VGKNRAVFIDRDGTIARDVPYCSRPEDFELFPGAPQAIRLMKKAGFKVVVITNQSGVGRGYFTETMLHKIHARMCDELASRGAPLDGVYYCPHHPDDNCECRKPKSAMFRRAEKELGIDLARSYMVGDMALDVEAGKAVGCKTVLIAEPVACRTLNIGADKVAGTLTDAAEWILGTNTRHQETITKK